MELPEVELLRAGTPSGWAAQSKVPGLLASPSLPPAAAARSHAARALAEIGMGAFPAGDRTHTQGPSPMPRGGSSCTVPCWLLVLGEEDGELSGEQAVRDWIGTEEGSWHLLGVQGACAVSSRPPWGLIGLRAGDEEGVAITQGMPLRSAEIGLLVPALPCCRS
jgi:hypothetical protein